jgi:hypothetical protein
MLTEHDSLEEVTKAFMEMPEEMKKTGVQLVSSKKQSEHNLNYQWEHFAHLGARVFWWEKVEYNGVVTFVTYEALFD